MTGVPRQEMPTLNVGKANAIRTSSCGVHGNVGYAGANLTHTPAAMGPGAEIANVRSRFAAWIAQPSILHSNNPSLSRSPSIGRCCRTDCMLGSSWDTRTCRSTLPYRAHLFACGDRPCPFTRRPVLDGPPRTEDAKHKNEEQGYEQDGEDGAGDHTADHADADGVLCSR